MRLRCRVEHDDSELATAASIVVVPRDVAAVGCVRDVIHLVVQRCCGRAVGSCDGVTAVLSVDGFAVPESEALLGGCGILRDGDEVSVRLSQRRLEDNQFDATSMLQMASQMPEEELESLLTELQNVLSKKRRKKSGSAELPCIADATSPAPARSSTSAPSNRRGALAADESSDEEVPAPETAVARTNARGKVVGNEAVDGSKLHWRNVDAGDVPKLKAGDLVRYRLHLMNPWQGNYRLSTFRMARIHRIIADDKQQQADPSVVLHHDVDAAVAGALDYVQASQLLELCVRER